MRPGIFPRYWYISLDVTRLAVQWITVCLLTIGLSLALREARGGEKKHSDNRTTPAGIRIDDPAFPPALLAPVVALSFDVHEPAA